MKDLLDEKGNKEYTWEEASEAADNLAGLGKILLELHMKDLKRKKKLEEFPKGFKLEGGYSCNICGCGAYTTGDIWYDNMGYEMYVMPTGS